MSSTPAGSPLWIFPPPGYPIQSNSTAEIINSIQSSIFTPPAIGWGSPRGTVHVGDEVTFSWKDDVLRDISINCMVCEAGPQQNQTVWEACDSYTDVDTPTIHVTSLGRMSTNQSVYPLWAVDPFSLASFPQTASALCLFVLSDDGEEFDYPYLTSPFPFLNTKRTVPSLFNYSQPEGATDYSNRPPPSSGWDNGPSSTSHPCPNPPHCQPPPPDHKSISPGAIAGAVVAAFIFLCMIGGLVIFQWKRKEKLAKKKDAEGLSATATPDATAGRTEVYAMRGRIGQRGGEEDPPPAYHDVVGDRERLRAPP